MQKNFHVFTAEKTLFCVSVNGATSKHKCERAGICCVNLSQKVSGDKLNTDSRTNYSVNFGSRIEIFQSRRKPLKKYPLKYFQAHFSFPRVQQMRTRTVALLCSGSSFVPCDVNTC